MMKFRLALVTGATSGIGAALCQLLATRGINLIATGRQVGQLMKLQEQLGNRIDFTGVQADLSIAQEREKLVQLIHERSPDLVINNAGFGTYGEALTYSTADQLSMLEVNGKAVLELTLESGRTMFSNQQSGVILNVSSAAAFQVFPAFAIYAATKAFVNHFSQALDDEFRSQGIRVLVACPGMVETEFQTHAGAEYPSTTQRGVMTPEEVAELIWKQIVNQEPIVIMNWKYQFLTALTRILPQSWLRSKLNNNIQARIKPRKIIKIKK